MIITLDREAVSNWLMRPITSTFLLWSTTPLVQTYEILNADNKVKETARQGLIIGGGAAGGLLAGLGVSILCGPGAPFCAIAVVLIGSVAGGVVGSGVAEALDDELEEFSHWDIF